MAQRASKAQQGSIESLSLKFDGGLNLSEAPSNIADNELTRAYNYIYDAATGTPIVRPGTTCQTAATCNSTWPILKIYNYEKSSTESWLVAACYGKLYYLSGASLNAWTEIGSLNDTTTVPCFLTFHAKLLIADGGTNIKTWDGTTFSALGDGLAATAIASTKGRVIANSTASGSNDLVTFSGPNNETYWNTATEGAVALRAGFGDNMSVNGFAVFGDDVIVSKKGDSEKKLYRIDVSNATTTNWSVSQLTDNNCSVSPHTIVSAFNNVFFADTNGFKSLKGVTEYGDLQVDFKDAKMNPYFTTLINCHEMTYVPYFSSIWFLISEHVYAYHHLVDPSGNVINAFTEMMFAQGTIKSVCQVDESTIYLAGNNGYLYKLDLTDVATTDETAPGVTTSISATLQTKQFPFSGGGILRRCEIYLKPLNAGTAYLYCTTNTSENVLLKTITLRASADYLYDATGYLYDATEFLHDMGNTPWYELSRNRTRGGSIQFKLTSTSGRVGVEGMKAEVALVEGD